MKINSISLVSIPAVAFLSFATFGACEIIGEYGLRNTFKDVLSIQDVNFMSCVEIKDHGLEGAFNGCNGIETVSFNQVTNVLESGCERAFVGCSSMNDLGFRALVHAGRRSFAEAFENCDILNTFTMDNLEDTGEEAFAGAFANCHSLESVQFEKLRELGECAFRGAFNSSYCNYNTLLSLPSLCNVSSGSFSDNNRLSVVYLPSVTNVGEMAFANCENLEFVVFSGVTNVAILADKNAFSNVSHMASIVVPAKLYNEWILASNWCDVAGMIVPDIAFSTNCDFYVSENLGNDRYDGFTPWTPKKTIDAAIASATNHQVIGLMKGNYAYPSFYRITSLSGCAYPVTLRGLSEGVYIDKPFTNGAPSDAKGDAFITGCTTTWSTFENICFRNLNKGTSFNWCFCYCYLYNCTFEESVVTQREMRGVFSVSVLERCKIRNFSVHGYDGYGKSAKNRNPTIFDDCLVLDTEIDITTTPDVPEASNTSLGNVVHAENCYLNGGNFYSVELYKATNSSNFIDSDIRWHNCTVIPESVIQPNGWCYSWNSTIPIRLENCLVGIDGMTNNPAEHVSSIITNRVTMESAIDPMTKRPDSAHSEWRSYGYRGRPLMSVGTTNDANPLKSRRIDRVKVRVPLKIEDEK